jgi:Mg-chelatase subunit ChlD
VANAAPRGEPPTGSALRGACRYAAARRLSAPDRRVAVLLVTDGEPQTKVSMATCDATLPDAVAAAQDCLAGGVRTYVLGVGPALDNLGQIAAAGGTMHAYLVASGARQLIVDMLTAIRADARP